MIYEKMLAAAVTFGLLWALMLSATLRCALVWLIGMKLTLRQEVAFWIVIPVGLFLSFLASGVQTAIVTRQLIAIQSLMEKLRLEQRPRRLAEQQIISLKKLLAPAAGQKIAVWCYMGDAEACSYAEDLLQTFRDAKWQTESSSPTPSVLRMEGTVLLVDDPAHLSETAALVESALRKSKVSIRVEQFKTNLDVAVLLLVGRKEIE